MTVPGLQQRGRGCPRARAGVETEAVVGVPIAVTPAHCREGADSYDVTPAIVTTPVTCNAALAVAEPASPG